MGRRDRSTSLPFPERFSTSEGGPRAVFGLMSHSARFEHRPPWRRHRAVPWAPRARAARRAQLADLAQRARVVGAHAQAAPREVPNRLASTGICAGWPLYRAFRRAGRGLRPPAPVRKSRSSPGGWRHEPEAVRGPACQGDRLGRRRRGSIAPIQTCWPGDVAPPTTTWGLVVTHPAGRINRLGAGGRDEAHHALACRRGGAPGFRAQHAFPVAVALGARRHHPGGERAQAASSPACCAARPRGRRTGGAGARSCWSAAGRRPRTIAARHQRAAGAEGPYGDRTVRSLGC